MKLRKILCAVLAVVLIASLAACGTQTESTTTTTTSPFAQPEKTGVTVEGKSVFNNIDYTVYIPSGYDANAETPVLMALHGGFQGTGAIDAPRTLFADFIGMNAYADQYGFIVIYPRQATTNHFYQIDYWNWYTQQSREDLEPKALYDILCEVKSEYNVSASETYICGFSAGAVMAETMAVTYPDVFAGLASVAGISYKACGAIDSVAVQTNGPTKTNEELAQEIVNGMGDKAQVKKALFIYGADDAVVSPKNSIAAASAWSIAMGQIDSNVKSTGKSSDDLDGINGVTYNKTTYALLNGEEICTLYKIYGMGHLWPGAKIGVSLDPFYSTDFAFEGGIDASRVICEFFDLDK